MILAEIGDDGDRMPARGGPPAVRREGRGTTASMSSDDLRRGGAMPHGAPANPSCPSSRTATSSKPAMTIATVQCKSPEAGFSVAFHRLDLVENVERLRGRSSYRSRPGGDLGEEGSGGRTADVGQQAHDLRVSRPVRRALSIRPTVRSPALTSEMPANIFSCSSSPENASSSV